MYPYHNSYRDVCLMHTYTAIASRYSCDHEGYSPIKSRGERELSS